MDSEILHNAKILIVDDEASDIRLLHDVLRLDGYTNLQSIADAREVLHGFADYQPDLLLLDLGLDYLDGFQIMEQLALLVSADDYFPILVITGDAARETRHRALSHGAKDFLTKPFDPAEILLRVRNLLETRFLHHQIQQQNQQLEETVRERTVELTQANTALQSKVAEQERTETALRHSEIKFRSLMESAADAIVLTDQDHRIIGWNRSAQVMFGHSTGEVLGQTVTMLLAERYRGVGQAGFHEIQESPGVHIIGRPIELSGLSKEGMEFPIEVVVSTWQEEGNRYYSNVIRDIAERKRDEHELRRSEMLLAEAQRLAHLGSWEWSLIENTIIWSDELYHIYGLSPQEFEPTLEGFLDLVHPADREFVNLVIERALNSHQPFEFDHRIVLPDGTVRAIHQQGIMVVSDLGQPIRMFGSTQDVTVLRQMETSLQESKEQLQIVLNAVPNTISWISSDLRYLGVNTYLADLLRVTPEQVVGREVGFLGTNSQFYDFVHEFFATPERAAEREIEISVGEDTRTFWLMARKYQHNQAAVFVGTDITSRKQGEQALQQTNEQLQLVLDVIPGGVSWITSELEYLAVNHFLAETFGIAQEAFVGQHVGFLDTDEGYVEFLRDFFAGTEQTASREIRVRVDGAWHTILMTARKHNSDKRAVVIGIDITERKKAEEALQKAHDELEIRVGERTAELNNVMSTLQQQKELLQTIFDHIPVMISFYDVHGTILLVNREWEHILGWSFEEMRDHPQIMAEFYPDVDDREQVMDAMRQASGEWHEFKTRIRDGRFLDTAWINIRLPDGRRIGIGQDITAYKSAAAALQASKAEADQANRAKSEFLARMSHELRTPLNAILGFTQLLAMDERTPREAQNLDYILKAGRHLLALVDEVLNIARIESGRVSFSIEPVQISIVVREAMELVGQRASELNVQFHSDSSCDRWALADRQRLQQVLLNLLSNAIKYNRAKGEVRVFCEIINSAQADLAENARQEKVRILVRDTGIGIPEAMQRRLFIPFDRLGAEHGPIEGTGIGLALSRRLIEAMGGSLSFESTEGQGSTFWIELPLVDMPSTTVEDPEPVPRMPVALETEHTILYIEDNLSNLHLIESILSHRPKIRLLAAMQGSLGLELARERLPDLILLDLHLPDMPGDEVLRRLRAEAATRVIPTVVLSADATPGRIRDLLESGASAYLTKPLKIRQFLQTLEEILHDKPEE